MCPEQLIYIQPYQIWRNTSAVEPKRLPLAEHGCGVTRDWRTADLFHKPEVTPLHFIIHWFIFEKCNISNIQNENISRRTLSKTACAS